MSIDQTNLSIHISGIWGISFTCSLVYTIGHLQLFEARCVDPESRQIPDALVDVLGQIRLPDVE